VVEEEKSFWLEVQQRCNRGGGGGGEVLLESFWPTLCEPTRMGGGARFFFRLKQRQTRRARTSERRRREFVTKKNEMEHAHIRVGTPAETERWECWGEVREVLGG
jgi:hypothetical protein